LFAGEDGLSAYHAIAPDIYRLLNPDGITVIECGEGQMPSVVKIFGQVGLEFVDSRYDIANIERCGIFRRSKALNQIKKKGWKAGKTPLL
jgi:release factor glutamine methyltransferase